MHTNTHTNKERSFINDSMQVVTVNELNWFLILDYVQLKRALKLKNSLVFFPLVV